MAFQLLRAVTVDGAHSNVTLPQLVREAGLTGQDARLCAELGYGALRTSGTLDEIIGCCSGRRPSSLGPDMLNLLRLGAHQLLNSRVPPHLTMSTTADLARRVTNDRGAINFAGAVLHEVATAGWNTWAMRMSPDRPGLARISLRCAHPEWIAAAYSQALSAAPDELEIALRANDRWPDTDLVAWPGRIDRTELAAHAGGKSGRYSPYAVRLDGGDPFQIDAVRDHRAGLQDEGRQLGTIATASAPLHGRDERWLDLCAGPGASTTLLALIGAQRGARVTAVELRADRAAAVRQSTAGMGVEVLTGDARTIPSTVGGYDRVLVDAPCSGLGKLRSRPEARWTCRPCDIRPAAALQAELVAAALRVVRPGGVVGYLACSPHPAETSAIVAGCDLIDARSAFPGVEQLGTGPTVRLWPHRHGTEAMFCALLRG